MKPESVKTADDVCALPLVRRLAAMLDRDPGALRDGDPLPRGWHPLLFNAPTRQSDLRADGTASLGVELPAELGLTRLMLGGRRNRFEGDIPIGARVRRETRSGEVQVKQGRSGRFALVKVEHRLFVDGTDLPAVVEQQDYVLREASTASPAVTASPVAAVVDASNASTVLAERVLVADKRLLFRYSSITDNPHRIHYDHPYTLGAEGYPRLVVNGSIPGLFLLEMFRHHAERQPSGISARNVAPMFCGQPLHLRLARHEAGWRLWAENDQGQTTFDAQAE